MNRKYFLKELEYHLRKIPKADREEMIIDFEQRFTEGLMEDKSEAEVAAELGKPKAIADELLANYKASQPDQPRPLSTSTSTPSVSRSILAAVGLGLFNLIIMVGPIVAVLAVFVSFVAVGVAFTLSPLAWVGSIIFGQSTDMLGEFFIVLTLSSFGVLLSIAMFQLGKLLFRLLAGYLKLNIRIIKG